MPAVSFRPPIHNRGALEVFIGDLAVSDAYAIRLQRPHDAYKVTFKGNSLFAIEGMTLVDFPNSVEEITIWSERPTALAWDSYKV